MGNDGSGKTTIAEELMKIFRELGSEVIYKHEYQYTILKFLFRIIGLEKIDSERNKMLVERKKSWKYFVWPLLVWFDVFCSLAYFRLFKKKSLVILDRYLYDHYESFKYLGYLTKFSEWLFKKCSPKPDIGFVLLVKPRIAYLRKKSTHDYDISFYEEQTKKYIELSRNLGIKTVDTNKSIKKTIDEIIKEIPNDKLAFFIKKGIQNRVLFSVIEKYGLTSIYPQMIQILERKKKKLDRTSAFIKDFFEKIGIKKYCIIKTLYSEAEIGNDVDILVSNSDFRKIVARFKELNTSNDSLEQKFMVKGKADINVPDGFPIDLHSYIGWRNVVFIPAEDILNKNFLVKRENGLYFANEKINIIIFILAHVFEKGFITLNELKFLKINFDELFMKTNFPHLYTFLSYYILWIKKSLREKQGYSYPLFVPISIIFKCYFKLLFHSEGKHGNVLWKLKAFVRDISFIIFWRIRYVIKNKLPFEVDLNGP